MATLNSIDGVITSGGDNPTLGVDFPTTLYKIQFPANVTDLNKLIPATYKSSITYVNDNNQTRTLNMPMASMISSTGMCYPFVMTDRIKKIISIDNAKLSDQGLVFNIAATTPAPIFISINTIHQKDLNTKRYRVYFGTPNNVNGSISYVDQNGTIRNLSHKGTTADITTTKITNYSNIRIVDLNPEVEAIKKIIPPPIGHQPTLSLARGTYNTIASPVASGSLSLMNVPQVPLASGGDNPTLGTLFAATSYDFDFPEVGTGTIEYIDNNRKLKTYTLNKLQIMMPNGLLSDGVIQFNKIENVKIQDKGLMYKITEPVNANFINPTSMPLLPKKPKFYQVYFGNPVCPQGSIVYFDAKGANKAITRFGDMVVIDAYSIYNFWNVKIVEVGDWVDNLGNGVPANWVNPQNPEGKYPVGY